MCHGKKERKKEEEEEDVYLLGLSLLSSVSKYNMWLYYDRFVVVVVR